MDGSKGSCCYTRYGGKKSKHTRIVVHGVVNTQLQSSLHWSTTGEGNVGFSLMYIVETTGLVVKFLVLWAPNSEGQGIEVVVPRKLIGESS